MRHLFILFLLALSSLACRAQEETVTTAKSSFQAMRQQLLDEFNDFRKEANKEYAVFLSQAWEEFTLFPGESLFEEPKLPQPIWATQESGTAKACEIDIQETNEVELAPPIPAEIKSQLGNAVEIESPVDVSFYGATLLVHYRMEALSLPSTKEDRVTQIWTLLSETKFNALLLEMVKHREKMRMNDWAYFLFAKQIAQSLSALKDENSRLLFQFFLLVQSGYDVRLTRIDDFLALLVPIHETVYSLPYLKVSGKFYYVFSNRKLTHYSTAFSYQLPSNGKSGSALSLQMKQPLLLPKQPKPFAIHAAGMEVKGEINLNRMELFRDYPQCDLQVYAKAMPDKEFHQLVMNALRKQLTGNDSIAMLNKLLLWVQTGFKYQTDEKQFGYEKSFFIEENFYYPYNDCEDRSLLFCYLVKQLLGFDAVLLDYDSHIATAIQVDTPIPGDYIRINRKRYIICDPTFVHAKAGRTMLKYKEAKPKVRRI